MKTKKTDAEKLCDALYEGMTNMADEADADICADMARALLPVLDNYGDADIDGANAAMHFWEELRAALANIERAER